LGYVVDTDLLEHTALNGLHC